MIVSLPCRGIGAAVLAAGLLLAGCSSDSDVPKTIASSPSGGTQVNTDTGSGGSFPDVNSVPTQRPTSTIQDLNQAPEGLSGAPGGTQYGEPLVGGPTSSAEPPAPPPPPEPAQEELAPIPEPGIQTQSSDVSVEAAPVAASEAVATPDVAEPQPMEPVAEAAPIAEPAPEAAAESPQATASPEGQVIQGSVPAAAVQNDPAAAALAEAPVPQQPVAPIGTPQPGATPFQPEPQLALAPGSVQTQSFGAAQQAQLPASAYGANYRALAPEAYGIMFPQPVLPPYQGYNPAQAMYRSPYANPPTNYGGASGAPLAATPAPAPAPTFAAYGQPYYGGTPVGLIYFREGSSRLSSDDRSVLRQIAEMHRAYGGYVTVVGHASMRTGTMDLVRHRQANQRISEARAEAVARQLMRYGVPQAAIRISAVGDTQPLYSEVMPSGEAGNRRAEVYLTAY